MNLENAGIVARAGNRCCRFGLCLFAAIVIALSFSGCSTGKSNGASSIYTIDQTRNITLAWNKRADPLVIGYNVLYGTESGVYTNGAETSGTNVLISGFVPGVTYYFAATCFSTLGTSQVSEEVAYKVPGNFVK